MCGIVGIIARSEQGRGYLGYIDKATDAIAHRGPDHGAVFTESDVALGHRRLSVIDTSPAAHQPMTDASGRYVLVYNGEIYNFRALRDSLLGHGTSLRTQSDTEVLVELFAREGARVLDRLNGFFAFAVYDRSERSVFIARDRFGIKPLHIYCDDHCVVFGSELSSILSLPVDRSLDFTSLHHYLQLSYVPAPYSILARGQKLQPGHYAVVKDGTVDVDRYYELKQLEEAASTDYGDAVARVRGLLAEAVERRLVADVPLGCFLSGGLDSTAVAAMAARHTDSLQTFSIGFPDSPRYDETADAITAARHIGSEHSVFEVREDDLYEHVFEMLNGLDEPFADPSALAGYILARHTRRHVTVALSGDGADELFGGYNKHRAELAVRNGGLVARGVSMLSPLWNALPAGRATGRHDLVRRLRKLANGGAMSDKDRYWSWSSFTAAGSAKTVLAASSVIDTEAERARRAEASRWIGDGGTMNDVLLSDLSFVLPHNMLRKVDTTSMAHGLEVRVPFLDHHLVEFVARLDADYKIARGPGKRILRDAVADLVPRATLSKPKHGFDVPLTRWFQTRMRTVIEGNLLGDDFVRTQAVFDPAAISDLRRRLFSSSTGDIERFVWALLVFQSWWRRWMSS